MINEIILHKIENSETDYVCDITSVIDEYIVKPKDNRCVSYLDDPEFCLRHNNDGKFICEIMEVVSYVDNTMIPIVFSGGTRGHVLINIDQTVRDIVLYNKNDNIDVVINELDKFKGRKIVIKS